MFKSLQVLTLAIFTVALSACTNDYQQVSGDNLQVVTSFYPLAEFTNQIGGDRVDVLNITPSGVEPHDYEPTPGDLSSIENVDLFIFNGNGLDVWAESVASNLDRENYIQMSDKIEAASSDPHFWLDPVMAEEMVKIITKKLIEVDKANAETYQSNSEKYTAELKELHADFQTGLSNCRQNKIIVSHDAFGYLADRYDFETVSINGISPEEEPSAGTLAEIADLAEAENIKYIFFETLASTELSETIANEAGVQTLVLNPLEGLTPGEIEKGEDYVSVMQQNLENLSLAMECEND